jgi:chemotaxis protein methyltransferase CheR
MPATLLVKWFRQEGAAWILDERIRRAVTFSPLNLAAAWPEMPEWDLVLLRNVMIYFDAEVKKSILRRISRSLARDGYLVLGGAETTLNLDDSFVRNEDLKGGFYQLKS